MLIWIKKKGHYGPPKTYLYAGKNKVGHVTKTIDGSGDFVAMTYLPLQNREDCIVLKGGEGPCLDELSSYTKRWFYDCGYAIDINTKVENSYVP